VNHGAGNDTVGSLTINNGNSLSISGGSLSVTRTTTVGGTLTTSGGTLNLNGGLANTGTLAVSAGTLNLAGSYTPANLGRLVGTGGAMRLTGMLINAGSTLTLDNTTGNLDIAGTVAGGTLAVANGSTSKYLSTNGALDGVTLAGNLQVNPNGNLTIRNGLMLNNGRVYLGDGVTSGANAYLWWDGTQTIGGSGEILFNALGGAGLMASYHATGSVTLTLDNGVAVRSITPTYNSVGSFDSRDMLINNGTLSADAGALVISPGSAFTNNGLLRATTGGLSFSNLASNDGIIQIDAGGSVGSSDATLINGVSGIIKGSGTLNAGPWPTFGTLTNNGTISPGDATSVGKLSINGNLINNGTIQTRIGGTAAGQYDVLAVNGNATLGGTLTSTLINGFTPSGQSFDVITSSSASGGFATSNLPAGVNGSIVDSAYRLTHSAAISAATTAPTTATQAVITNVNNATAAASSNATAAVSSNATATVSSNATATVSSNATATVSSNATATVSSNATATVSSTISNRVTTSAIAADTGATASTSGTNSSATSRTGSSSASTASATVVAQSAASLSAPSGPVQTLGLVVGNMTIGGTEGTFGGVSGDAGDKSATDKSATPKVDDRKDADAGTKKQAEKPAAKKIPTCS
jgi:hypothetical protein